MTSAGVLAYALLALAIGVIAFRWLQTRRTRVLTLKVRINGDSFTYSGPNKLEDVKPLLETFYNTRQETLEAAVERMTAELKSNNDALAALPNSK